MGPGIEIGYGMSSTTRLFIVTGPKEGWSRIGIFNLLLCVPVHPVNMAELLISSREILLAKTALFPAGSASTGSRSTAWTNFQVQWAAERKEWLSDEHPKDRHRKPLCDRVEETYYG
jgi:hypothetical protein